MLRYTLANPNMHTTIAGTADLDHLADNLRTAELGPLPPDVYAQAQWRLSLLSIAGDGTKVPRLRSLLRNGGCGLPESQGPQPLQLP